MSYNKLFLLFALIALLFRLYLAPLPNYTSYSDLLTFKAWGVYIAQDGPRNFYSGVWSDYLPGYLYILWLLSFISSWLTDRSISITVEVLYKLPSIMADLANGLLIYLIAKKVVLPKKALITSIFFLFNPAIFANSTLWGQADSFMTLFLLSSFYFLLKEDILLSFILLGIGQTIKPIAILCLPIFIIYLLLKKYSLRMFFFYLVLFAAIIIIAFIPFNNTNNLFQFIIQRHAVTSNQYPYTTVNAINFWSIIGNFWRSDQETFLGITLQNWGYLLFGTFYSILLIALTLGFRKAQNKTLFLTFVLASCFLGMFIFLTRMHERHTFFALSFITLLLPSLPLLSIVVISISFPIYIFNLYLAFSQITQHPFFISRDVLIFISIMNVTIFLYLLLNFYRYAISQKK